MEQNRKALIAFTGLIVLILTTASSACYFPTIYDFNPIPTMTIMPVTILLVDDDIKELPAYLSEPLLREHLPVRLQEAPGVVADAVLISRKKLLLAGEDAATRESLLRIIENGKLLLVYRATTRDLAEQFKLGTPSMTPTTTYYAVATIGKFGDVHGVGGVLMPKGYDEETHLLLAIREHVTEFRLSMQRALSTETPNSGGMITLTTPTP
jgi:hypothetical protein